MGSAGGSLLYRIQRLAGDAGRQRGPSKLPGILALSLGLVCFALNMQWARGQQQDAPAPEPGVRVDLGGATVIHRDEVEYPDAAIEKGVQGTVVVEATLDAAGEVSDARVLSGPLELRKAALQSVLQWHFTHDAAGSTRQVTIGFQLPADVDAAKRSADQRSRKAEARAQAKREQELVDAIVQKKVAESMAESMARQARNLQSRQSADAFELQNDARKLLAEKAQLDHEVARGKLAELLAERSLQAGQLESQLAALRDQQSLLSSAASLTDARASQIAALEKRLADLQAGFGGFHGAAMFAGRRLKAIDIQGLTTASRDELLSKLPLHVGDTLAEDSMDKVEAAVKLFDRHLALSMFTTDDGQVEIRLEARHLK